MFSSKLNCVTGQMEWVDTGKDPQSEDTDLSEEFSRSQYGDMLHDTERNRKYELGLKWAVSELLAKGVEPRVLDIGSGTGLLSLMAARNGANDITAIEVLKPMVKILNNVVRENGFQDRINVISKHSTDVRVGLPDGDMQQRANILVTEVFDSELIGEGAVPTFRHAHQKLLEKGAVVIPSEGTVYVQLIQSDFLRHSHTLDPKQSAVDISPPGSWWACQGPASLWDIHLEEVIRSYDVIPLSEPHVVAKFNFSDPALPIYKEYDPVSVTANESGLCSTLAIWWSISFAPGVELSMSPWQTDLQWRDHWLPCVQVLPRPFDVHKESPVKVQITSDEYTMWATIISDNAMSYSTDKSRPVCTCGVHLAWSKSRLRTMNDLQRNKRFLSAIDKVLSGSKMSSVLCVGDGSLLPIMCSQRCTNLEKIFVVENNKHSLKSFQELIQDTPLPVPIQVINKAATDITIQDVGGSSVDAIIAEPFFITTSLPWHNLYYWYVRSSLIASSVLVPGATVMPCAAVLKAIAVKFQDLHLLKARVGTVEEFDIGAYDRAVANAHTKPKGESLEPEDYALWEYPCYPLSGVQTLMNFDFTRPLPPHEVLQVEGKFPLNDSAHSSPCHGIVLWMEYQLTPEDEILMSEGLLEPPDEGSKLVWSTGQNQGVCFFMEYEKTVINYSIKFEIGNGEMDFKFF